MATKLSIDVGTVLTRNMKDHPGKYETIFNFLKGKKLKIVGFNHPFVEVDIIDGEILAGVKELTIPNDYFTDEYFTIESDGK